MRQPLPKLESRLAALAFRPSGWNLGKLASGKERFDGKLYVYFEAMTAFNFDFSENLGVIDLERIARVVRWNASQIAQSQTGKSR